MLEADDLDTDSEDDDDPTDAAAGIVISRTDNQEDERTTSFDIYVKGQQTRLQRGGEATRFRMFPYVERRGRKIDGYGEGLDLGLWLRKGREIAEEGETQEVKEAKSRRAEEEKVDRAPVRDC